MKKYFALSILCLALLGARTAQAQSGCADSPENSTLVLAGLAAGAFGFSRWRARRRS